LKKIAVTGVIGSGKTTLCRLLAEALKEQGVYVLDADSIVNQILTTPNVIKSSLGQEIINALGPEVITNNQINKRKTSEIVFSNPEKLEKLEKILHPVVRKEMQKQSNEAKTSGNYRWFIAEVPLLYESGMHVDFDQVVVVTASQANCALRLSEAPERLKRSHFQYSQETKKNLADFVISNDGSLDNLKDQVENLVSKL
jgi:dephospho-CoA kinase